MGGISKFPNTSGETATYSSVADFEAAGGAAAINSGPVWMAGELYNCIAGNKYPVRSAPDASDFVIPFGDSITATMWRQLNLSGTITVSGGIATFTTASAHLYLPGSLVRIGLCTYAGFNGIKEILTTPTSTTFTVAVDSGAPASENIVSGVAYFQQDQNFAANFIHYFHAYSKHRFYMPINGGLGGDDSTEAKARLFTDLINYQPGRAIILLGTNNMLAASSTDISQFVTDMTYIYQTCLAAGIAVDACTIPPLGSGHTLVSNTTAVGWMMKANRWIRDYVKQNRGMRLHDIYQWITDPAQANGQAKSGMINTDNVHPTTALGAMTIGKAMAANYDKWLGAAVSRLPSSQADGYSFDTSSKNRWLNHLFQGAGPVATSWSTAFTGAGNTKADSVVARTVVNDGDALGNNQQSALTVAAAGTHLVYQDPTARLTAGKTYIAKGCVKVALGGATITLCEINITFTVDSIVRTIRAGIASPLEDGSYYFETPPFKYPSGTLSSIQFYLKNYVSSTTGSPTVSWGRVDLEQQD